MLTDLGVPPAQIEHEIVQMQQWHITPTSQGTDYKKVLGTQKQLILSLGYRFERGRYDHRELAHFLNTTPCGPAPYRYPGQTTREMFAAYATSNV